MTIYEEINGSKSRKGPQPQIMALQIQQKDSLSPEKWSTPQEGSRNPNKGTNLVHNIRQNNDSGAASLPKQK